MLHKQQAEVCMNSGNAGGYDKLIQVISWANLFVEKHKPTHRRAALNFGY